MQHCAEDLFVTAKRSLHEDTLCIARSCLPGIVAEKVLFFYESVSFDVTPAQIFRFQSSAATRWNDGTCAFGGDWIIGIFVIICFVTRAFLVMGVASLRVITFLAGKI